MSDPITRLAPSPTGALHLGNARTFLLNHLLARRHGWRMLMRVEDLPGPRIKPHAAADMLEELAWLGLQWEQPVIYQSARRAAYDEALAKLARDGWAYPCTCSRKDVESAALAPHADDAAGAYPGACRGRYADAADARRQSGQDPAWRVRVEDAPVRVNDHVAGTVEFNLARLGGDFVIVRREGLAAYQLAVVVDDEAAGVNRIVRGDDLLDSAARQEHLRRLLGMTDPIEYWHLPLVVGPDGRRLAKRHGDTRLAWFRQHHATRERVLGLLGFWSGLLPRRRPAEMAELADVFDEARLPQTQVVYTRPDHDFLLTGREGN
ncbi:MAG: tRNA glutamyl-Q(34) synthetase GluQRS [Planctomycetota bacterium]|nr:tRNA glutamyl-Q(34) synthetase GluQRS [Planctomycetota bacterium]